MVLPGRADGCQVAGGRTRLTEIYFRTAVTATLVCSDYKLSPFGMASPASADIVRTGGRRNLPAPGTQILRRRCALAQVSHGRNVDVVANRPQRSAIALARFSSSTGAPSEWYSVAGPLPGALSVVTASTTGPELSGRHQQAFGAPCAGPGFIETTHWRRTFPICHVNRSSTVLRSAVGCAPNWPNVLD